MKISQEVHASYPKIIQGGMGAGISSWCLARTVSRCGQLGVVSGTALDTVLVRKLYSGDPGGHYRRALEHFPIPAIADRILKKFYQDEKVYRPGKSVFPRLTMLTENPSQERQEILVLANFAEVFLAKHEHSGVVGINFLEKIQISMLPSIYGAVLAGVDYVLVGAGIPREIPGVIDRFVDHQDGEIRLSVVGAKAGSDHKLRFSPRAVMGEEFAYPKLLRPKFLGIIASSALAVTLAKKASGKVDGFVIEGPTAGGHNAPPRGTLSLNGLGEPIYGPRDDVDLTVIQDLGLPFWLAGSFGSEHRLSDALQLGAAGIQVGTAFALSEESGMDPKIRTQMLQTVRGVGVKVFTDPLASPTGFPFKVAGVEGTMSEESDYVSRKRVCDLGYLRHAYEKPDGSLGFRCPSEPVDAFEKKGGELQETVKRKCLCNGLMATMGLPQFQADGSLEKPIVTIGDQVNMVGRFMKDGRESYSAKDVVERLLAETESVVEAKRVV
jgi:nitronate monooxygenase